MSQNRHTVLLRLGGPLQSWGSSATGCLRTTGMEPTKSGVLGMICSAMGLGFMDSQKLSELNRMAFGVRVDRQGSVYRDFRTGNDVPFVDPGKRQGKPTEPSHVWYLADALFTVGMEGTERQALDIYGALFRPARMIYMGRACCLPDRPICSLGPPVPLGLLDALSKAPMSTRKWERYDTEDDGLVRVAIDESASPSNGVVRAYMDSPVSFGERRYGARRVSIFKIKVDPGAATEQEESQ